MGASDSKLLFKQGIHKLSEKPIPRNDDYWANFWELPESPEDIFSLFSSSDIRRIRSESLTNFESLILVTASRLRSLRETPAFPNKERAPEKHALNCIRILTRLLPFAYEDDKLEAWEEKFFWEDDAQLLGKTNVVFDGTEHAQPVSQADTPSADGTDEAKEKRSFMEVLIDTLIDLLFYVDFTIPRIPGSKAKINMAIWQSGVGCNSPVGTSREFENNRMEVLRLLLTITSKSMYISANLLPVQGVKAITYITTLQDKQLVQTLLCSLLNTTLKYNPSTWRMPYEHMILKDPRQIFVTYCLQLLLVTVIYPVPETATNVQPRNQFRHFLGKLHRPKDFQFLVEGMTRVLNQPLQANTAILPGSQKSLTWAPEMIMLFWETLQCNKRFRSFIVETDRAHDFMVLMIFYAIQHQQDQSKNGIVRMCIFILQTMSAESAFGTRLNKPFQGQETLPQVIRIQNFRGSYGDFLIMSLHTLFTSNRGGLDAVLPAFMAVLNNIAPHLCDINSVASTRLLQLFALLSSPDFLLLNDTNHSLLESLLEVFNSIVKHQYDRNPTFVYAIIRSRKRLFGLQKFLENGGEDELERLARKRKELAENPSNATTPVVRSRGDEQSRASARPGPLPGLPEGATVGAFTIEDEEDDENNDSESGIRQTPSRSSIASDGPAASIASSAIMDTPIEDAVPMQLRGMSEKARGKMPASQTSFSRHSSATSLQSLALAQNMTNSTFEPNPGWVQTWVPEISSLLTPLLTLIRHLLNHLPPQTASTSTTACINAIRRAPRPPQLPDSLSDDVTGNNDAEPLHVHLFRWSPLSLGWYTSVLWSLIFSNAIALSSSGPIYATSISTLGSALSSGLTSATGGGSGTNAGTNNPIGSSLGSGGAAGSGAANVWKGTHIKLFRVMEGGREGPTLMSPRGAVDAVGSNLVQGFGRLGLGLRTLSSSGTTAATASGATNTTTASSVAVESGGDNVDGGRRPRVVRDV